MDGDVIPKQSDRDNRFGIIAEDSHRPAQDATMAAIWPHRVTYSTPQRYCPR